MPGWSGSSRRRRLPRDWPRIRAAVLARDGQRCQMCGAAATEVDHIAPGDDHGLANLRALCRACHRAKSSAEGGRAPRHRSARRIPRQRPGEKHPGIA